MDERCDIDVTFDFRSDTPLGKDPDALSPTLRRYHLRLWSKPLPNGAMFDLKNTAYFMHHRSVLGEFFLSSDSVIPTFSRESRMAGIVDRIPRADRETFDRVTYTIGGMMVFPGNRIGGKATINSARGFHPRIKDRFDLTMECLRRHYRGESSPLADTVDRYRNFFGLFGDFRGYVEYFLLQDLVTNDCSAVKFFAPFKDFTTSPLPKSLDAYLAYRQLATEFVQARNRRILLAS
jgi:hypothetical protein